jgi:hypothetical protein
VKRPAINIIDASGAEMEIGRAAEHLVVADLIVQGYRAFLTDQGLPYDVVVDVNGRLHRLQVKATCRVRNVNAAKRTAHLGERFAYTWHVRRGGRKGRKRLSDSDCDIIALVALDMKRIAYIPVSACGTCVNMRLEPEPGSFGYTISEFEKLAPALEGKPKSLMLYGRRAAIRRNGQMVLPC